MLENQSTSQNGCACLLRFLGTMGAVFELSGGNRLVGLMLKMSENMSELICTCFKCIARDVVRLRSFVINISSLLIRKAKEAQ